MAHAYEIRLMPEAARDLQQIFDYVEKDSPQHAPAIVKRILDAIDSLQQLPRRCKVHRSSRTPRRVVRSMSVPPYIIYYRVYDQDQVVEVLTVRHGARRQPRRFK